MPLHRHRPAPQGARRASGSHPSTSARTPELSIARASSLDHSPPSSRNVDPTPSPSTGWAAVYERFFLWRVQDAGIRVMFSGNSGLAVQNMMAEDELAAHQLALKSRGSSQRTRRRAQRTRRGRCSERRRVVRAGGHIGPSAQLGLWGMKSAEGRHGLAPVVSFVPLPSCPL